MDTTDARIRDYQPADGEAVVALSLRAWAPVFGSMELVLGHEIFARLHGDDWRDYQARSVRDVLADDAMRVWVTEAGGSVAGFVAATVFDSERRIGEIAMLAVDPACQHRGLGTALTEFGTAWLRDAGMRVAMIGTGGDPGHAPARRVYAKADYTLIPMARYFKAL
jgi:ribosomal protein S18 acetylase RimI-like enzyme